MRTVAFMIVRQVLGLVRCGRPPDAKDVEIAVLRATSCWCCAGKCPGPDTSTATASVNGQHG